MRPAYKKDDAERMVREALANNSKVYVYRKTGDGAPGWVLIH